MKLAVSRIVQSVRDTMNCRHLRWQSQRRGKAQARSCLANEKWLASFRDDTVPDLSDYADLFRYFVAGFVTYRSPLGAHADYIGMHSYNGPAMDRLEGFSRIAPLMAAWLHGGRPARIDLDGRTVDLVELLREGLLNGTDPASAEYWGEIRHWSQAIVEAADIALTIWLSRPLIWDAMSATQRTRIADWLGQVNHKRIPDNNWHLFIAQVNTVLAALGERHDAGELEQHYQRAKAFHCGGGWFRDGNRPDTPGFDYYNAWGFHYHLGWVARIAPDLDGAFIDSALRDFVTSYRYLVGPSGFPILGRSACYRMAAPAPLVMAQANHSDLVSPGQAKRALDATWQHFVQHDALAQGNVVQGYLSADPRLLENYSGPASCLWSLRSLIPAFAFPDDAPFWQAQPEPLPIEQSDYRIEIAAPGWTVVGNKDSLSIALTTGQSGSPELQAQRLSDCVKERLGCKPCRPANVAAKYRRARYDSVAPYGIAVKQSRQPHASLTVDKP